jgi:hypothetical protein
MSQGGGEGEGREKVERRVGYIYGWYKMFGSTKMDETFFPITYTKDGYS